MTLRMAFCLHSQLLLNAQLCKEGGLRIYSILMLLFAMRILLKSMNIKPKQIHILSLTEPDSQWSSCIVEWKMHNLITCTSQDKKSFKFWKTEGAWGFWFAWAQICICYTAMIILLLYISKGLWFQESLQQFSHSFESHKMTTVRGFCSLITTPGRLPQIKWQQDFRWIWYILQMGGFFWVSFSCLTHLKVILEQFSETDKRVLRFAVDM